MDINGQTKLTGLIGDPILYSQSPSMHNAAFAHLGLNYVYLPLHVKREQVAAAVEAVRAFHMAGINVTVPHKETVIPFLDELDETALRCGAVNTIVSREEKLIGYNTDGLGFIDSLRDAGFTPQGRRVVFSAGGSARAVASALLDAGAEEVVLMNRTVSKAQELAELLGSRAKALPLTAGSTPDLTGCDLVVNTLATSFQTEEGWLLDLHSAQGALFYDLRYGRMPSAFLDYARELKSPGLDGLGMLLHQGARAFTLFTGLDAPVDVMRRALQPGR